MKVISSPTSNTITLNRNSTRADRSKHLAQLAVSKGRHVISLREARLNVRVGIKEAAEAVGITERTLKRWEVDSGRANSFAMHRLCQYYAVSMDHVFPGKEEDLVAARKEASTLKKTIRAEDIVALLKHMGHDTSEMESYLEEIRASWEDETKNAPATGIAKAFVNSHM